MKRNTPVKGPNVEGKAGPHGVAAAKDPLLTSNIQTDMGTDAEHARASVAPGFIPNSVEQDDPTPNSQVRETWKKPHQNQLRRDILRSFRWIFALPIFAILALIFFLTGSDWDWFRPTLASFISSRIHRPVYIEGHLEVHLFSQAPSMTLEGFKVGQPLWARHLGPSPSVTPNLAEIKMIDVRTDVGELLGGKLVLNRVAIFHPVLFLHQQKGGLSNWDWSDGANKGRPLQFPPIKNLIISDGDVTLISLQNRYKFSGKVTAHEGPYPLPGTEKAHPGFVLTSKGSLNNRPFQMNITGDRLETVRSDVPYTFSLKIWAEENRIEAIGRVLHPFNLGQMDASITFSGKNLADLYNLTGLAMPDTQSYSISAQVSRNGMLYSVNRIDGRFGSSDLQGKARIDVSRNGRPYLTGDLSSRVLDFNALGSLFGATARNNPTAPKMAMAPMAQVTANHVLPDAPLDVDRVRGMDANISYRAMSIRGSPYMPLRQVNLKVALDHGLLILDPVDLSFSHGLLKGTARIDARTIPQINAIDFQLTDLRLQDFVKTSNELPPLQGILNGHLRASGTGNTSHKAAATANGDFTLTVRNGKIRQSLAELSSINATKGLLLFLASDPRQTNIRCAVADFHIQNGVMKAQNIVFDTDVVSIKGTGSVKMSDESLKFAFKGKPKKFRLFRIDAPILIGGHLSAPKIGVSTGPVIAQVGLAAVLGSVLPFVPLDYGKDANCAAVISKGKSSSASRVVKLRG